MSVAPNFPRAQKYTTAHKLSGKLVLEFVTAFAYSFREARLLVCGLNEAGPLVSARHRLDVLNGWVGQHRFPNH